MRHLKISDLVKFRISHLLFLLVLLLSFPQSVQAMSDQDEIDMGCRIVIDVEKQIPLVKDPALQERVQRIGMSLVKVSDRPNLPYTFKVLDSKEVNAFAIPGGFIYVYKGLIDLMPSDDELAGVIGHEIGHIVKRHSVKEMEKGTGMNLLLLLLLQGRYGMLQAATMEAIMAGHSRDDEREADYLGFKHTTDAGYSPYSMLMGLEKLSQFDQKYQADLFSDHPEGKERIALMKKYLADAHIHPFAKEESNSGIVFEGTWTLPALSDTVAGSTPLDRAYSAAGQLYQLTHITGDLSADKFIAVSVDNGVSIYYEDRLLFTVTSGDGVQQNLSVDDFASVVIDSLQEWVQLQATINSKSLKQPFS
jgi:Zn-dependent protease with chaperone function